MELTDEVIKAFWANMPSTYEIDTECNDAQRQLLSAIFAAVRTQKPTAPRPVEWRDHLN